MAKAKVINQQIPLSINDIIRFQINLYCFINKYRLSPAQIDCLALLGMYQPINISDFCEQVVNKEVFTVSQTARNFIIKSVKDNIVVRSGLGDKLISLNPDLNILTEGTLLLNLKVYHYEEA
jgi:hypothetical protein